MDQNSYTTISDEKSRNYQKLDDFEKDSKATNDKTQNETLKNRSIANPSSTADDAATTDNGNESKSKRPYYIPKGIKNKKNKYDNPSIIKYNENQVEEDDDGGLRIKSKLKQDDILNQYGARLPLPMVSRIGYDDQKFNTFADRTPVEEPSEFYYHSESYHRSSTGKSSLFEKVIRKPKAKILEDSEFQSNLNFK